MFPMSKSYYRWLSITLLICPILATLLIQAPFRVYSQGSTVQLIESDDSMVLREGNWSQQSAVGASSGSYLYSNGDSDDVLILTFTGTTVEVVYIAGPNLGILAIEVDNTVLRTVITQSETALFGQHMVIDYLTSEPHILRVYASQGMVAVDGFFAEIHLSTEANQPRAANRAWLQSNKLVASDGSAGDLFGQQVAISGDTAIVGAQTDDDLGMDSGSAYIFTQSGGNWTQTAKLIASDGDAGDWFGWSVAISGDTLVIGAVFDDDHGISSGSAYIFTRNGGSWTQTAKLIASDGAVDNWFGQAVAISGDTVIIGAPGNVSHGAVYVFARAGANWIQTAKLTATDGQLGDEFGRSVGISGNTCVVGSYNDDDRGIGSGSAYIFTQSGNTWTQTTKLLPSDGDAGDWFGWSVAISGDTTVIAAYMDDDHGISSGSAYIFTRSGGSWTQTAKLIASDGVAGDAFGEAVTMEGDTVIVGAYLDDDRGSSSGSAYVFTRNGGNWTQVAKLTASDGSSTDFFGGSVGISNNLVLIGAHYDDDRGADSGSAYVFETCTLAQCNNEDGGLNGVLPQQAKVFFINGICTTANQHRQSIVDIQAIVGASHPVMGIYSAVQASISWCLITDIYEALAMVVNLTLNVDPNNPAVLILADQIRNHFVIHNAGSSTSRLEIIGHSQGALVIARALEYLEQSFPSFWAQYRQRINVITLGGASPSFPLGPHYQHFVHRGFGWLNPVSPDDPVPAVGVDNPLSMIPSYEKTYYIRHLTANIATCGLDFATLLNHSLCSYLISFAEGRGDKLTLFNPVDSATSMINTPQDNPPSSAYSNYYASVPSTGQWVMGDWDGNGLKTPGVYARNGVFYYTNYLGPTSSWNGIWFGLFGRPAVAGRFDGTRSNDCIGVVDSANFPPYGVAFAMYFTCDMSGGNPPKSFQWLSVVLSDPQGFAGLGTHQFAAGDFNRDGVDSIAIRRGPFIAYTQVSPAPNAPGLSYSLSAFSEAQYIGAPNNNDYGYFLSGDWDNNGLDSFGLFYQNGYFYRRNDLQWNSGDYILQRVGQPIGTPVTATSWRQN